MCNGGASKSKSVEALRQRLIAESRNAVFSFHRVTGSTLKPGSPLQCVWAVSVDRATVSKGTHAPSRAPISIRRKLLH
jgi:hypothetical protein